MSNDDNLTRPVSDLAEVLECHPHWLAAKLAQAGVDVDDQGRVSLTDVRALIERAGTRGVASPVPLVGDDQESCRQWLAGRFEQAGLEVLHREERRKSRFTLRRPDGSKLWVMTYVALKTKPNAAQIGFTAAVGRLGDGYDWHCFIAQPWGKAYLRSRLEMKARWKREGDGMASSTSVTISAGATADLFENRIAELLVKGGA